MFAVKSGLLCLTLLGAGCGSSGPVRSLAPAASNPAVVEHNRDGTMTLRSQQRHIVSVLPTGERFSNDVWGLPSLYVIVANGGSEAIALKPGDISAYAGDHRVAVLSPVALQDRLDRQQVRGPVTFPVTLTDASQPAESRHVHPSVTRPRLEPYPALEYKVPARLVTQALQPQVIPPGDVGGGRFVLEAEDILSGLPLKIVVSVAGENHEFVFEVRY